MHAVQMIKQVDIESKDQITLNIDTNIVSALIESRQLPVLVAISKLPGVTLELTDVVADIEMADRLVSKDGDYLSIRGNPPFWLYEKFVENAQRHEFIDEFSDMVHDPNIKPKPLIDALESHEAHDSYPDANIVIARTRLGAGLNAMAYEEYLDLEGSGELHQIGENHKPIIPETIALMRYKEPGSDQAPDSDMGEQSMIERENYMHGSLDNRFLVSNDGTDVGIPGYCKGLDQDVTVNIANLSGVIKAFDTHFHDQIVEMLPGNLQKDFSFETVMTKVMQADKENHKRDFHHAGRTATIDAVRSDKNFDFIDRTYAHHGIEEKYGIEVPSGRLTKSNALDNAAANLKEQLIEKGAIRETALEQLDAIQDTLTQEHIANEKVTSEKPVISKTQKKKLKRQAEQAEQEAAEPVSDYTIKDLPKELLSDAVSALEHDRQLFTREQVAEVIGIDHTNATLENLWHEQLAEFADYKEGEVGNNDVPLSQSYRACDIGVFLNEQGNPEIMVSNPAAVFQAMWEENPKVFNEQTQSKLDALMEGKEAERPFDTAIQLDTLDIEPLKIERITTKELAGARR